MLEKLDIKEVQCKGYHMLTEAKMLNVTHNSPWLLENKTEMISNTGFRLWNGGLVCSRK